MLTDLSNQSTKSGFEMLLDLGGADMRVVFGMETYVCKVLWILALLISLPAFARAAPPSKVLGKSIILSWGEERTQRVVGNTERFEIDSTVTVTIYVSTAGRHFFRQHMTVMRAGRNSSSDLERGPGDPLTPGQLAGRLRFQGSTMSLTSQSESGARQIVVTFDETFASCTGKIVYGRQGGAKLIMRSQITGQRLEVESLRVKSPNCSVRDGNALGG